MYLINVPLESSYLCSAFIDFAAFLSSFITHSYKSLRRKKKIPGEINALFIVFYLFFSFLGISVWNSVNLLLTAAKLPSQIYQCLTSMI